MDYLNELFKMQKRLQAEIGSKIFQTNSLQGNSPMGMFPNQNFVNLNYIGVITEASEALEKTPWKPWKDSMRYNRIEFQKELIDIFHFLMNLFLAAGMEPQDVYRMYKQKHIKNMKRQERGY